MRVSTSALREAEAAIRTRRRALEGVEETLASVHRALLSDGETFRELAGRVSDEQREIRQEAKKLRDLGEAADVLAELYAQCERDCCQRAKEVRPLSRPTA